MATLLPRMFTSLISCSGWARTISSAMDVRNILTMALSYADFVVMLSALIATPWLLINGRAVLRDVSRGLAKLLIGIVVLVFYVQGIILATLVRVYVFQTKLFLITLEHTMISIEIMNKQRFAL